MTLKNGQLRFLRIRLVANRLALSILRPGLLGLTDLAKQVIFLFLEFAVAGLQALRAICGGLLWGYYCVVLCVGCLLFTLGLFLLLLICGVTCRLLGRIRGGFSGVIVKPFLNVLRQ